MMDKQIDPHPQTAITIYRCLAQILYPLTINEQDQAEMAFIIEQDFRDVYQKRGWWGLLWMFLDTLLSLLCEAFRARIAELNDNRSKNGESTFETCLLGIEILEEVDKLFLESQTKSKEQIIHYLRLI